MGHSKPNPRCDALISISLAAFAAVGLPIKSLASVDAVSHVGALAADNRLALSDVGEIIRGGKPEGKLTVPPAGNDGTLPDVTDDTPTDVLETDVTDEESHAGTLANVSVSYDLTQLPKPVMRMRELIVDAAVKGDIEGLRPLLGTGPSRTELSIGGYEGDPIDFLREISGDGHGRELLAILLDIFQTGYAHLDAGEPTELYLWPYFYSVPLDSLDDRQMVELFRIITAGDYEDMQAFGAYIFYRTGISPDGQWKFFVAGD